MISEEVGADNTVAAIGPAGENLVPYSVVVNSRAHTAGCGIGAVMGSKMLKAIALQGSQPVHIAGDKADWEKLINYHRTIIGANNQHEGAQQAGEQGAPDAGAQTPAQACCRKPTDANPEKGQGGGQC